MRESSELSVPCLPPWRTWLVVRARGVQTATNERAVRPGEHEGQHRQNAGADDSEYAAKIGQHEQDHCRKLPMSGGGDLEGHRDAIDAVAKARRLRAVLEHMTKVATATAAVDSRPHHTERGISRRADGLIQRRPEARPASAALKFGGRGKQVEITADAGEIAAPFLAQKRVSEGTLRRGLPQHRILIGSQTLPPFG